MNTRSSYGRGIRLGLGWTTLLGAQRLVISLAEKKVRVMNAVRQMTIGEPFNPRFEACGFHPEEIDLRRHNITDGQRFLYHLVAPRARARDGHWATERALFVGKAPFTMGSFGGPRCRRFFPNCAPPPGDVPA